MTVPVLRSSLLLTLWGLPTAAAAQDDPYDKVVDRIESLYLWQEDIEPASLLLAASRELEEDVSWLMVDTVSDGLVLRHGESGELGRVHATGWHDLADALREVEALAAARSGASSPSPAR